MIVSDVCFPYSVQHPSTIQGGIEIKGFLEERDSAFERDNEVLGVLVAVLLEEF